MKSESDVATEVSKQLINIALQYADDILRGVTTPYEGGRRIWMECQLKLEQGNHRLDPFVYWASEYEETTSKQRQSLCEKALRESAATLKQTGSAL